MSAIFTAIDQLVADLSEPTTVAEEREGWDDALKNRWRDWFVELKENLENGRPVPAGWGILRAMDFDGVNAKESSRLTLQAGRIGELLDDRG